MKGKEMRSIAFMPGIVILVLGLGACGGPPAQQAGSASQANACNTDPRPLANVQAAQRNDYYTSPPEMTIDPTKIYRATIRTSRGDIELELDAADAPQTVNNFVFLGCQGFYDGLTFHRYEPGFVIQGGDPLGRGDGGPGYVVPAEIGLPHVEGAVAMARLPDQVNPQRDSSGSQFYITLASTPFLDGAYTVFGQVVGGMDVVQTIRAGDKIERVVIQQ
jgi:peptidyl-prolyl cis-trans isomerase B (cyclophilin B)